MYKDYYQSPVSGPLPEWANGWANTASRDMYYALTMVDFGIDARDVILDAIKDSCDRIADAAQALETRLSSLLPASHMLLWVGVCWRQVAMQIMADWAIPFDSWQPGEDV